MFNKNKTRNAKRYVQLLHETIVISRSSVTNREKTTRKYSEAQMNGYYHLMTAEEQAKVPQAKADSLEAIRTFNRRLNAVTGFIDAVIGLNPGNIAGGIKR